jgi:hypothetical protein
MTEGVCARLSTDSAKYTVFGIEDGPCYLKTILIKFFCETRATNYHLRQKLQQLPLSIDTFAKQDIAVFNDHVRELVQDLAAGGETSNDLIVYIFDAYLTVNDNAFIRFIERKKEVYDDGTEEITAEALMDMALNKFNQLKQSNTWKAKSPEQEKIVALIAQLQKDQANSNSKVAELKSKIKDQRNKDDKQKGKIGKRKYPDWRYKRNDSEYTMLRDGKTWHWCEHHEMWCEHTTNDCRAKKASVGIKKGATKEKTVPNDEEQSSRPNALSLAKALVAITEDDYTSDGEEL